jgi:hypothetical protein
LISPNLNINHLLFIDDVLIFYTGQWCDAHKLYDILELFIKGTCMNINEKKFDSLISQHRGKRTNELYGHFTLLEVGVGERYKIFGFPSYAKQLHEIRLEMTYR